jgi:glycosyltransferase involved in cell wall biosynthesis
MSKAILSQRYHVCVTSSTSGIADYATEFHQLVLAPAGYALCAPDELPDPRTLPRDSEIHVQLGAFQYAERRLISRLLSAGHSGIDATIHDPPFASFPYVNFDSPILNRLSRGFDWYLRSFGLQRRLIERLRRVFVLSERGKEAVLRLAPRANVIVIPHIVDPARVWPNDRPLDDELIYFGFIGPNKGLEHVLHVHEELVRLRPGVALHVVGRPSGDRARRYLDDLRRRFSNGVTYHGYVPDDRLDTLFAQAAHVLLPYAPYHYIIPTSGSVVHALRRARIVWTTPANAMPELISDGRNGFMLTLDPVEDARRIAAVMADPSNARRVSEAARTTALSMADFPYQRYVVTPAPARG